MPDIGSKEVIRESSVVREDQYLLSSVQMPIQSAWWLFGPYLHDQENSQGGRQLQAQERREADDGDL